MSAGQNLSRMFPDQPNLALPRELLIRLTQSDISKPVASVTLLVALVTSSNAAMRAISERAFGDHPLVQGAGEMEGNPIVPGEWPWAAVEGAVTVGLLIRFLATSGAGELAWLMLNTEANVARIAQLVNDPDQAPAEFWIDQVPPTITFDRPTLFRLYEQNIGPLTPLIAQRLIKAGDLYPTSWVEEAIVDAVTYNRRSWRYISRILENRASDSASPRR